MSLKIRFTSAAATEVLLAKIGHPQREEPLQTSKEVYPIDEAEQEILTPLFLKPFRNLAGHRFSHHSSLEQHEMNALAAAVFGTEGDWFEKGCAIARRLYAKSNHPNIKSGDLCISRIRHVEVEGALTEAICILKSESVTPFLSISAKDGDLRLSTERGIHPEKIDKGCLILNHFANKGYYVLTFDRSGSDSRFWVRDFLGVLPVTDPSFLTHQYAKLAVSFAESERKEKKAEEQDDGPPWETADTAREALAYFEGRETFSLQEFEEEVLKTPEAAARFAEHRAKVEEEQGHRLEDRFEISKKDVTKAKRKIRKVVKLDTGVELHLTPDFADEAALEHGFDEGRGMKFIKVYFNEERPA